MIILMEELFLQTRVLLFLDPQPRVQVSPMFRVREEERGKSKPEKCFRLVQRSMGQLDFEPGRT